MLLNRALNDLRNNAFTSRNLRRNFGVLSVLYQKTPTDPVQKLFVDKIREYAQKAKSSGGKLVDASPQIQKELDEELVKIERNHGGGSGIDLKQFPSFKFEDPALDSSKMEIKK